MKGFFMLLYLAVATSTFSQQQTIQLNLTIGNTYSHVQQSKSIIIQTINGQDTPINMELSAKTNYYIKSAHDSVYDMMVSYERLGIKNNGEKGEMEFSSDSSKQDITSRIFQAFVHKPFLVVMTRRGRIIEIHIDSILLAAINQVEGLSQQQKESLTENFKKSFGGEAAIGNFEMFTAIYPSIPVAINSSWPASTKLRSLTLMDLTGNYTLQAINQSSLQLHGEINMVSEKQDSASKVNGIPIYYDLSGQMITDIEIDKASGWITGGTVSQKLKGTIKFLDSPQIPGGLEVPASILTEMALGDK